MSDAHVLFCWEYGAGLGHFKTLELVANRTRDLYRQATLIKPEGTVWSGGPFSIIDDIANANQIGRLAADEADQFVSHASLMHVLGCHSAKYVFARLSLWKKCFERYKPDLVVADFSPFALMAARNLSIPTLAVGNGYALPPHDLAEFPKLLNREEKVSPSALLAAVNEGARIAGCKPLSRLPQLFEADQSTCFSLPEFDPFQKVRSEPAPGPLLASPPPTVGLKTASALFVYLTQTRAELRKAVLTALVHLVESGIKVSLYSLDLDKEDIDLLAESNAKGTLDLLDVPMPLEQICREHCAVLHLGGHMLAMELLLAGMPQLVLPIDYEKIMLAQLMKNTGLGAPIGLSGNVQTDAEVIHSAMKDATLAEEARAYAERQAPDAWRKAGDRVHAAMAGLLAANR